MGGAKQEAKQLFVGTEERGAEGTETPISPWAKDGADPPNPYPIDEIKENLENLRH